MRYFNYRKKTIVLVVILSFLLFYIFMKGHHITDDMLAVNFLQKNLPPSSQHVFGTDHQGRDMFLRTLKGLALSSKIGLIATGFAVLIAAGLTFLLALGGSKMDAAITWLIDVCLSLPQMLMLILISVAVGKGEKGVILSLSLTHWTGLTRLMRAELKQLKAEDYLQVSQAFGKSKSWIMIHHIVPHLMGQMFIAAVLLFPHAILHESGISFLGFGLPLSTPAIGIILSESMNYIHVGYWWLGFFPGLLLVLFILLIYVMGNAIKTLLTPYSYHR